MGYWRQVWSSSNELKLRNLRDYRFIYRVCAATTLAYCYLADLQVCPSQKPEGLPLVIRRCPTGLPVVASGHSGIRVRKSGKTGLFVEKYKDPVAIAEQFNVYQTRR